jgi:cell wall-associated NlpC family hydrolase
MSAATKAKIVEEARRLLSSPFAHQGRGEKGVDCAGLVILVAHRLGLSQFDCSGYRRLPGAVDGRKIEDLCAAELRPIEFSAAEPGDVALFLIGQRPRHMAILGSDQAGMLTMIHAYEPAGRVVENILDAGWKAALCGVYEIKENG